MILHRSPLALVLAAALLSPPALAQTPAPAAAPPSATAPAPAPGPTPAAAPAPAPAPAAAAATSESGKLAWYGRKFAGRRTASGEPYNPDALTMAHKSLPFGTKVRVTNLANKRSVELRVNDRGPTQGDRIGDVSFAAAKRLGMVRAGVVDAEVTVVAAPAAKKS